MSLTRYLLFTCILLFNATASYAGPWDYRAPGRVVAFADVHGAYDDWVALLRELQVIDEDLNWSGGNTTLVSLGDLIDRGPGSRDVVELLMKLDTQAGKAGGEVHMVLGNHEVMVMTGDLRYVSRAEFAAFAGDETTAERDALFADYVKFNSVANTPEQRSQFDQGFPPGYVGLMKAYAPDGPLGSWLMQQPFVIKVNDRVYMHGGIASELATESLESLNSRLMAELRDYLNALANLRAAGVLPLYLDQGEWLSFLNARAQEFSEANPEQRADWFDPLLVLFDAQKYLLFGDDSPNWYRGTAFCHPYSESFNTERFLKRAGARQLVMGHTPTQGEVVQRMDGLALRLDTGMLKSVYRGRAAALVSTGSESYIHYLGDSGRHEPVVEQRSLTKQLSGLGDAQMEDFLRNAEIVGVESIGTGITKPKRVTQSRDGFTQDAVFKYLDSHPKIESRKRYIPRVNDVADRYQFDVAAYELDRMLDLQMVPVAVMSEVEGTRGVLQDWVVNAINERDRLESGVPFSGHCDQLEQYRLRFVFDILIYNEDRNLTNILWSKDDYMLRFIDHTLAFRTSSKRPKQYRKVSLKVSDLFRSRLQSLTKEGLGAELSPYLHPRQISAIIKRRDRILNEMESTDP